MIGQEEAKSNKRMAIGRDTMRVDRQSEQWLMHNGDRKTRSVETES